MADVEGGQYTGGYVGRHAKLGLTCADFTDLFSLEAKHKLHINVLEGEAFLVWLRWLLRTQAHHGMRVVALIDSAAWLGAVAKGRSSSQLNRLLRKVAALCFLGDVMLYVVFVPSIHNPSDGASRGVKRRGRGMRTMMPYVGAKLCHANVGGAWLSRHLDM